MLEENSIYVALSSFTGKAAFNIRGSTLHSLFHLPVQVKKDALEPLSADMLKRVRKQFASLKLLIIDEISMVGYKLFSMLNKRLQQIMDNKDIFGGVSIIVVGDFNQICPVQDTYVFQRNNENESAYEILAGRKTNFLWDKFKFIELLEIMRQQNDKPFANALNALAENGVLGLTREQIDLFNSRIVRKDEIPREAICLLYANESVNKFNSYKLQLGIDVDISNIIFVNESINLPDGQKKHTKAAENLAKQCALIDDINTTCGLPMVVKFRLGYKYMITTNISNQDGLTNGAVGILRKIVFTKNKTDQKPLVKRVYLQFDQKDIGMLTRQDAKTRAHMRQDKVNESDCWTLVQYKRETIKRSGHGYHCDRIQFNLVEAEAITIHKSQGQTYECVAVDIEKPLPQAILYVALSRCTRLNSLYLFGSNSIESRAVQAMSYEKRKIELEKRKLSSDVHKEIKRLRQNCLLQNYFPLLDLDPNDVEHRHIEHSVTIMFQNIQRFDANRRALANDFGYEQADIVLMVECHNKTNERSLAQVVFGQTHQLVYYSSGTDLNASNGQACYVRKSHHSNRLRLVAHNANDFYEYTTSNQNKLVELCLFEYSFSDSKKLYILSVYKHPKCDIKKCLHDMCVFLKKHLPTSSWSLSSSSSSQENKTSILILGDFNVDFNKQKDLMTTLQDKMNMLPLITNETTFKNISQLDWSFKNKNFEHSVHSSSYDTWFSDHSAIFTRVDFD